LFGILAGENVRLALGRLMVAGFGLVAAPALAQEPLSISATTGIDYSSGKYGAETSTELLVAPLSLRIADRGLSLTASVPYLRIDSPGGVVVGPGGEPIPGVPTEAGVRKGFGDLSLAFSYDFPEEMFGAAELTLGGRVVLPTSSPASQLGTGKTGFSGSAEISYPLGNFAPFVSIGYRAPGDPEGVDLRNGLTGSVGTSLSLGRSVLIVSYDYARASSRTAADSHELFGAFSRPLSKRLTLTGYGIVGLSEGSPDFGAGLLLTAKLYEARRR
jgi:hypothetical protein